MGLALDEPREDDKLEVINGITVAIDTKILPQTENLTLDFQDTPQGKGLVMLGENNCC